MSALLRLLRPIIAMATLAGVLLNQHAIAAAEAPAAEKIAPYQDRFGRRQPVVAIVGENQGTELTDFVIPYGVLARSGAVQLLTVATKAGPIAMRPALRIQPDATIKQFDTRFPDGADYVIVPAVLKADDAALLAWVAAQAAKGATVVGISDGALVLANGGLLKDHRAVAQRSSEAYRKQHHADTQWVSNTRYVVDGKVVSSAGISAAAPTALALVEAIAGHDRAADVARQIGAPDWDTTHDSEIFHPRFGRNMSAYITNYTNAWLHRGEDVGVPVAPGVDEIALALTADAWSRTSRSRAYAVAAKGAPLRTSHGLILLPDRFSGIDPAPVLMLPAFDDTPPLRALDQALAAMAQRYGQRTATRVAMEFEYRADVNSAK